MLFLQKQRCQCRRQRQCHDAGDHDGNRDGHRKLAIQFTREAAQKRDRNEHRAQREDDRDHRAADLLHRQDGGLARGFLLRPHDALDVFEHHDGIVDDDADRQHQPEQRQQVDRETEQVHSGEGADQRDRNSEDGNQRRPPALQKDEDDGDDQNDRLDERLDHFLDGDLDEARGVERYPVFEPFREARLQAIHRRLDALGDFEGIGARLQVDADRDRRRAIEGRRESVIERAQFDARDILDPECAAKGVGTDDDILELARIGEAALGGDRIGEGGRILLRFLAEPARRELRILFADRRGDIAGCQVELG